MKAIAFLFGLLLAASAQAKQPCLCGPAATQSFTNLPTTGFCAKPASPTSILGIGPWTWTCIANGCSPAAVCQASLSVVPTLSMSFIPPTASIPSTAPPGSLVGTVDVEWSNGAPFTGQLSFVPPYGDANGTFALDGNDIVTTKSVSSLADRIVNVTVSATQ